LEYLRKSAWKNYLVEYFLSEGRDKVFVFPKPIEEGPYELFTDKERVLKFLQTQPVENPKHNVVVDLATLSCLMLLSGRYNEDISRKLVDFVGSIGKVYRKDMKLEEIELKRVK